MKTRIWEEECDWPTIQNWFQRIDGGAPHVDHLPPLGIIAEDRDGPLAAVFAYQSLGVGVCFPEWCIVRPDAGIYRKLAGVGEALKALEKMLLLDDYTYLRIAILDERIARIAAKRFGFVNIGPKVHYLVKNLN